MVLWSRLKGEFSSFSNVEATVVVNKDHRWISLPLAKSSQSNPVHLANEISANQANRMLREHKLFAKASKCEMLKTSVEFLGQQISRGGMTPTKAKLKAVRDWATPEDVKGVRSFLGFANYYRRFVQNFVVIADPLT